ncbi:mas-related G-protein coupled receptor member H-like [Rhinophrynus dorsalis]
MTESYNKLSNNASTQEMNGTGGNQTTYHVTNYFLPLTTFSIVLCMVGLVGNVVVFWFLCFKIKKSQFTIYIINLAVADFTFLLGLCVWLLYMFSVLNGLKKSDIVMNYVALFSGLLYNFGFNAGIYLLTVIGLERCFAVLYPFWYQCQRPKKLSSYMCILMWILSILVTGLENFICTGEQQYLAPGSEKCTDVYFFTSALYIIVVSIMILSSLTLLLEIRKASRHCHPPRLYIVIIASISVFLTSVVPARILGLLLYFNILNSQTVLRAIFFITSICSAVNCSANPYIYMFVGRWRKQISEENSMKQIFEKVFKEVPESQTMHTA